MQNKQNLIAGSLIAALILIAGAWYMSPNRPAPAPSTAPSAATSTAQGATSTDTGNPKGAAAAPAKTPGTDYATNALPISQRDTLASWNFKGSYADGGALQQKAESQISSLKAQIDTTDPRVQEIYISIAKEYELLGDGKSAYNYFLQALNSNQRYEQEDGMAWAGLGDLMQTLHAYYTAATAYANAVHADPGEPSFHVARINFLLSSLPKEKALIDTAFADATKDVPGDASVAQLQAQYQKAQTQ